MIRLGWTATLNVLRMEGEHGSQSWNYPRHSSQFKSLSQHITLPHIHFVMIIISNASTTNICKAYYISMQGNECKWPTSCYCPRSWSCSFPFSFFCPSSQEGTSGKTALHLAVELHDVTSVKLLLNGGANVDAAMFNGCTPLHLAVGRQDTTIANLLFQFGADTMLRNMEDETALDLADGNYDVSYCDWKLEAHKS